MTGRIEILSAGPAVTVQDMGRDGWLAYGLARGGAADRRALLEAAALLDLSAPCGALEMAGAGGRFRTTRTTRFALTGTPMRAVLDGRPVAWNASHLWPAGALLEIGAADSGVYGYLTLAGGMDTPKRMGARATQAAAGLGRPLRAGDSLPVAPDPQLDAPCFALPGDPRFTGGTLRVMPGPQTEFFSEETRARFYATRFKAGPGNRQGLTLNNPSEPFEITSGTAILSEPITPGDIQMTGAGQPAILLADCQTIGGYPRIGTVIPADLPRAAQARPDAPLRFEAVTLDAAETLSPPETELLRAIRATRQSIGLGADSATLLGYQLIGGVIRGDEEEPWRAGSI